MPRTGTVLTREEDAGNVAGLMGIAHIVLRYDRDGKVEALRLHPLGEWTIWRYRRRIDAMEEELTRWLEASSPR